MMDDVWQTKYCTFKHTHVKYIIQVLFGGSIIQLDVSLISIPDTGCMTRISSDDRLRPPMSIEYTVDGS